MQNQLADSLNLLLADYQVFYQKLRNYHWNVQGPLFFELHRKFEELYTDAALQVDELAERVLTIGGRPLSTLKEQLDVARLQEDAGRPDANQMVAALVGDMESLNSSLREVARAAEDKKDVATFSLLDGMADAQEKTAWMLRAYLG